VTRLPLRPTLSQRRRVWPILLALQTASAVLGAADDSVGSSNLQEGDLRWEVNSEAGTGNVRLETRAPEIRDRIGKATTTADFRAILRVTAQPEGSADSTEISGLPAMSGTYRRADNGLVFEPSFPLQHDVRYQAIVPAADGSPLLAVAYQLPPRAPTPPTRISAVYPSAPELPENLLKFYLHFSAPMTTGDVYRHIHLVDQAGMEVELPFLEIGEELWNPERTRLTLLLDPGRIKRGVRPLEEVGSALLLEETMSLVIDRDWEDSNRQPLAEAYQRDFRVVASDRTALDPTTWEILLPAAGTRETLTVNFGEPVDQALASRLLAVIDPDEDLVTGEVTLTDQEQRWNFTPDAPWNSGRHRLEIATTLEDLAGNKVGRVFDVDVFENVQRYLTSESVELEFRIP